MAVLCVRVRESTYNEDTVGFIDTISQQGNVWSLEDPPPLPSSSLSMKHLIINVCHRGPRIVEKDLKYLDFDFDMSCSSGRNKNGHIEGEESDVVSIKSMSSNATADDIPGPGRTIDKYVYQFFGRKIERFANRFSLSRLPPARIAQRLWKDPHWWHGRTDGIQPVNEIIDVIYLADDLPCEAGAVVAGLKSLVRQTQ